MSDIGDPTRLDTPAVPGLDGGSQPPPVGGDSTGEIHVEARAPKWNLTVGSFWFDQSTAHLVRAVYRLSVPIDVWTMDETKEDMKDVPLLVRPIISPLKVGVDAISIEYGLYNGRFWMPKLQVLEAGAQVGMMRVPVQVEQKFRYASVNGLDSLPAFQTVTETGYALGSGQR